MERLEANGEAAKSTGHIAKQKFSQNFEQRENTIKKLYVNENLSQFNQRKFLNRYEKTLSKNDRSVNIDFSTCMQSKELKIRACARAIFIGQPD